MRKKKKVTGKLYSRPSHKKQKEDPIGSDFAQWNSERSSLEKNCDVPQALNRKRIIRSQDYNRNLLKYLNNDRQRHASFCDLVVIVEGKEFNVHKVVVAVGSSYFHACLSKNPQADIVNLDHVSSLVFQHLLEFLYTSEFLILENEITSVLEAARFLDIIDAVKLLTTETDFSTTGIQPLLDVAHESITKLESSHKCLLCQRTFCYKKTLENHMGKVHGFGKTDIVSEDFDSPTRKSMRKRKCPVKFENGKEQGNDLSIEACKSSQYRMDSEESLNEEVQGVEESGQEGEGVEESGQEGEGVEESSQEGEGVGESSQEGEGVEESSQENKGFEKSSQEGEGVEESRQGGEGVEERSQGAEGEKEISQGKKREEEISQREEKKEDSVQGEEGEEMDQGGEGEEEESEHEEEGEEEMSQRGEGEEEESEQEEEGEEEMGQGEEGEEESGQVEEGEEKELCFEDMEQSDGGLDEAEEANENLDTVGSYPDGFSPIVLQKSSKKILKCPKCEKVFDRMGKYESHIRVHTGEKPFECDICHQRYSTKSNLTVHKKRHNSETEVHMKEHKCPSCGKLHASKNTLGKHVKRFHPENAQEFVTDKRLKSEGWKCDICNKSFTRRPHLQEHMILHSQDKPFKCTYCEEHFKSRFPRLKHQEKYHLGLGSRDSRISSEEALRIELESPFPCDICGRQFNDTGNLKRHIEYTHGGKRKWTCFICGKSVRERTTLKEHLRIHSGEKPHLCSICGQNFRHGSSYRLHLRVHHDDKRYECNDCGKSFIRHDHLTKHRKIHSGEKEHQCEECGKCFGRRDHLTVHYKSVHLGEKVWQKYKATFHQCEVCKKVFKGKSSLDMHFRTHSGEKPYKCHICNQSFRIKKTLTKHLVIHSDARPFNCQYCNASFKRKDKLKYHIDHVHGSKAAEDGEEESREDPNNYPAPSQSVDANICMPLTLVPVEIAESEAELEQHPDTVLPTSAEYQRPTDLTFLEKYTLTPQPVTLLHPVRPEQIMESREHSYLGTLLGLDPPPPVQNIDTSNHH